MTVTISSLPRRFASLVLDPSGGEASPEDGHRPASPPPRFPVLANDRWTRRHTRFAYVGFAIAAIVGMFEANHADTMTGIRAFIAAAVAWAVIGFALTLPAVTAPGLVLGGFFVTAGILSWTFTNHPSVVWALLIVEGAVFAVWTVPWVRDLAKLPRMGAAWLGLAYWIFGILGATLSGHLKVGAERVVYGGLFILGALAVLAAVRRSRRDPTPGIVAAFVVAIGLLLLAGADNAFNGVHVVPKTPWGNAMQYRFWGGSFFLYHPNSLGLIAVIVAVRIAADRIFAPWQRYASLGLFALILLMVNSRTGMLYAGAAAVVHLVLVLRRARRRRKGQSVVDDGLPEYGAGWRTVVAVVVPFILVACVFSASGGTRFLFKGRYQTTTTQTLPDGSVVTVPVDPTQDVDVTSGRLDTWKQAFKDFQHDTLAEELFGNGANARGTVERIDTGKVGQRPKLTTDNAAVGALRRGGVAGELAFIFGCLLLAWHALFGRRRLRARGQPYLGPTPTGWFTMAAIGALPTFVTADWLLGGTGGTLWIFLLGAEAWMLYGVRRRDTQPTVPQEAARIGSEV